MVRLLSDPPVRVRASTTTRPSTTSRQTLTPGAGPGSSQGPSWWYQPAVSGREERTGPRPVRLLSHSNWIQSMLE